MPKRSGRIDAFTYALVGTIALSLVFFVWISREAEPLGKPQWGTPVGAKAPAIDAAGWINGSPPSAKEREGKIVVLIAWATWCGPCLQTMPSEVAAYEKYKDKGVVFIGVTAETKRDKAKIEQVLQQNKVPWPNGYGAVSTLQRWEAEMIPSLWVIGRDGKIVWSHSADGTLEDGIELALSSPATETRKEES